MVDQTPEQEISIEDQYHGGDEPDIPIPDLYDSAAQRAAKIEERLRPEVADDSEYADVAAKRSKEEHFVGLVTGANLALGVLLPLRATLVEAALELDAVDDTTSALTLTWASNVTTAIGSHRETIRNFS